MLWMNLKRGSEEYCSGQGAGGAFNTSVHQLKSGESGNNKKG